MRRRAITVTDSGPPLTAADLVVCAARIGRPIPPAYRRFLRRHNGGHPDPADFCFAGSADDGGSVAAFLGVNAVASLDLAGYQHTYRDRIPPTMFPIARDPGGNLILLVSGGPDTGAVYFGDHEAEAAAGAPPLRRPNADCRQFCRLPARLGQPLVKPV